MLEALVALYVNFWFVAFYILWFVVITVPVGNFVHNLVFCKSLYLFLKHSDLYYSPQVQYTFEYVPLFLPTPS